jgi:hypothetical protein
MSLRKLCKKQAEFPCLLSFCQSKWVIQTKKVSTKWVGTDSSKFWTLAGAENSTQWYSRYHGQVTRLPLSGIDAVYGNPHAIYVFYFDYLGGNPYLCNVLEEMK